MHVSDLSFAAVSHAIVCALELHQALQEWRTARGAHKEPANLFKFWGGDAYDRLRRAVDELDVSLLKVADLGGDRPSGFSDSFSRLAAWICGWREKEAAERFQCVCDDEARMVATCYGLLRKERNRLLLQDPALAGGPNQSVILRGRGEQPIVTGRMKAPLTQARHDVVKALLEAGERGLTKDELDKQSKHSDARKILSRLAKSDPDWATVIKMAGRPGRHYRIAH